MAFSATQAAAEYVRQGALGVGDIYTGKRKYSLSDMIVFQERTWAPFDTILRMEMKVVPVSDPEPKVLTMQEAPVRFDVSTASSSSGLGPDDDTVGIADAQALFLQAGDVLTCPDIFCNTAGTNYATDKSTALAAGYFPESMIVQSVQLSGLSSGVARVRLARANGNAPTSGVTQISTSMKLIHSGNSLVDGGNAPNPVSHEPTDVQNYCQFFSKTWGYTDSEAPLETYGKLNPAQRAEMKRKEFYRQHEFALLFGRKNVLTQSGGGKLWLTGGITEFMATASTALDGVSRYRDFGGAFDIGKLREETEIIYRYGSKVKHWFVGGKFFTVLNNALEKSIVINDQYSQRYGWEVRELDLGHGLAMLHRHPVLTEMETASTNYSMDAIVVDLEYVKLMTYIDTTVRRLDPGRAHKTEGEIFCQDGLWRTFPSAHAWIFGITA